MERHLGRNKDQTLLVEAASGQDLGQLQTTDVIGLDDSLDLATISHNIWISGFSLTVRSKQGWVHSAHGQHLGGGSASRQPLRTSVCSE